MYRIVSLLLIPLVLASQAFCAAHSHLGTAVVEPVGHANRPHVHIADSSGHHRHHDSKHSHHHEDADHHRADDPQDEPQATAFESPDDHDASAVYFPASVTARSDRQAKVELSAKQWTAVPLLSAIGLLEVAQARLASQQCLPPPFLDSHCPLYLRNLSLRI